MRVVVEENEIDTPNPGSISKLALFSMLRFGFNGDHSPDGTPLKFIFSNPACSLP